MRVYASVTENNGANRSEIADGDGSGSDKERLSTTVGASTKRYLKNAEGGMGSVIDRLVGDADDEMTFRVINTNARNLPDDGSRTYSAGVVAGYGPERFGEKMEVIDPGDGIISYVSSTHVEYDGGVRAFGIATAPFDGNPVPDDLEIYPNAGHAHEYQVPVRWIAVLPPRRTVTPSDFSQVAGRTPSQTLETPKNEDQINAMRVIAHLVLGKAGYRLP
jgi:hypothetical protein